MSWTKNRQVLALLKEVGLEIRLVAEQCDGAFFPITKTALVHSISEQLGNSGIIVSNDPSFLPKLVVEIRYRVTADLKSVPLNNIAKIETVLHEVVSISRNSILTTVDTWRHRISIGAYVGTPKLSELTSILQMEVTRQIENFISDIQRVNSSTKPNGANGFVKKPFPARSLPSNGILAQNTDTGKLRLLFQSWFNTYYIENNNQGRIKSDKIAKTVSEGIGYGMLLFVYFSDQIRSYQAEFDKLWNYYQSFLDDKNLMNWRINEFNGIAQAEDGFPAGNGSATDADLDVATALILAHRQFGGDRYLTNAQNLISNIRLHDFESGGLHKPGDSWNDVKNPSYVSPVAFELFKTVDDAEFWTKALSQNYRLLANNSHSQTGLVSDWSTSEGVPAVPPGSNGLPGVFSYDAARTPWRLAWAYAWYGHIQAKSINNLIGNWIRSVTGGNPTNIKSGYERDTGRVTSNGNYSSPLFTGAFGTALMSSDVNQVFLNATCNQLISMSQPVNETNSGYFHSTMQLLMLLLLTGNMPNI